MSDQPTATPDAGALSETAKPHKPAGGTCTTCGTEISRYVGQSWRHGATGSEYCPPRNEWADAVAKRLEDEVFARANGMTTEQYATWLADQNDEN